MEDIRAEASGMPCEGGKEKVWDGSMQPTKNLFLVFSQLTQSMHSNSEIPGCAFFNSCKSTNKRAGLNTKIGIIICSERLAYEKHSAINIVVDHGSRQPFSRREPFSFIRYNA
jgi:hypothetical protein